MAPGRPQFSVITRLLIMLAFGLMSLLVFTWFHFWEHEDQERALAWAYVADFSNQVERVLELHQEGLENFTYDYSWWNDMVDFIDNPNDEDWLVMAEGVPEIFKVDAVWVYNPKGELVYGVDLTDEFKHVQKSPFAPEEVLALFHEEEFPVFFKHHAGGYMQIAAAPIHRSDGDHTGPAQGYLISRRYWTGEYLERLSDTLDSTIDLIPYSAEADPLAMLTIYPEEGEVAVTLTGYGSQGEPVLHYTVHHVIPGLFKEADLLDWHSGIVFISALFFGFVIFICLIGWVILPLRKLSQALENDEDAESYLNAAMPGREWTRLKELIFDSIAQRKALRAEVAQRKEAEAALVESEAALREHYQEREGLARDLHDGIIQSVYAAGLQVETARLELDNNPEYTRNLLVDARKSLNVLIGDVRRFISGLTPSRLAEGGLKTSLTQLAQPLRQSGIDVTLDLDDRALASLDETRALHLFFIAQELMSNAARHSGASAIELEISQEGQDLSLYVRDNGIGFDENAQRPEGIGLKNVRERADILHANVSICRPQDGGGCTCITLQLP